MLSFSMRLTEIDLISSGVRNVKSTLSIADETGCEIFIVATNRPSDLLHHWILGGLWVANAWSGPALARASP